MFMSTNAGDKTHMKPKMFNSFIGGQKRSHLMVMQEPANLVSPGVYYGHIQSPFLRLIENQFESQVKPNDSLFNHYTSFA